MTKKEMNQIMEAINGINARLTSLEERVNATTTVSAKTSKKSSSKTTAPKTPKSSKTSLTDFEPKKDSDGNYNYKSWKTCRRNFVAKKSGKDLTKEWMDYAEFCKIAEPFDKKFPYVKKSDR